MAQIFVIALSLAITGIASQSIAQESASEIFANDTNGKPTAASSAPSENVADQILGELTRYKGDWIINSRRDNRRTVFKNGKSEITLYSLQATGCWSGVIQRSMILSFDPSTNKYSGKIKWTPGDNINDHVRTPWLDHDLTGTWDVDAQTFTWYGKSKTNTLFQELTIVTHFKNENVQTQSITPTSDSSSAMDIDNKLMRYYIRETLTKLR